MAYDNLKIVSKLGMLSGILTTSNALKRIDLAKKLFVVDMQEGTEVLIPKDLSQDHLPMSFRYYDPLIKIVQDKMADEKRDYYKLKNSLELKVYQRIDMKRQMLESLGLVEGHDNPEKLTFKYSAINKKLENEISVQDSLFVKGVQRS